MRRDYFSDGSAISGGHMTEDSGTTADALRALVLIVAISFTAAAVLAV